MICSHPIIHSLDCGGKTGYVKYNVITKKIEKHAILNDYNEIYQVVKSINKYNEMLIYEGISGQITTQVVVDMVKKVGYVEGLVDMFNLYAVCQVPSRRKGHIVRAKIYFKEHHKNDGYLIHNVDAFAHILSFMNRKTSK